MMAGGRKAVLLLLAWFNGNTAMPGETVSFSQQVMPILSEHCFACHGPDEKNRKGDLRLDTRENALSAIAVGDPDASELMRRIRSTDPGEQMPPAGAHRKALTPDQVQTLDQWIKDGVVWGRHWAFEPPVKPSLPDGAAHPIDALVRKKLKSMGLDLSPRAPGHILARRLSLDLTGLPPSVSDAAALVGKPAMPQKGVRPLATKDDSDTTHNGQGVRPLFEALPADLTNEQIEKYVDRLLESDHYGERMAMWWLDAARYADTDGFQGDETRTNWPWRDWVISAFNANMPFDRFTIEQFAGDLLPDATLDQKLATSFHRHHMTNGEGGRDPEESRIDYVIDRVSTTGTVWLGMTLGCCQCHSHKYDPVSQADFYSLSAFFNSIDEDGKAGRAAKPYLSYESPLVARAIAEAKQLVDERQLLEANAKQAAEPVFEAWLKDRLNDAITTPFRAWRVLTATAFESSEGTQFTQEADGTVQTSGPNPNQDDYRLIAGTIVKSVPALPQNGVRPLAARDDPDTTHVGEGVRPRFEAKPILPRITGLRLEVFPHESHTGGSFSRGKDGFFTLTDIKVQVRRRGSSQIREVAVVEAIADHSDDPKKHNGYGEIKHVLDDDPRNGWTTRDADPKQPHTAQFGFAEPLILDDDEELVLELRQRSTLGDANIGRFRWSATDQRGPAVSSLETAPLEHLSQEVQAALPQKGVRPQATRADSDATDNREGGRPRFEAKPAPLSINAIDDQLRERLRKQFLLDYASYQRVRIAFDRAQRQLAEAQAATKVDVMVLAERAEPRTTNVLLRGVWDKKGDVVQPDVPAAISPWKPDEPRSRLGLARWLVARDNPLTARVIVNHVWQLMFGAGLVRTAEDFGLQGERPIYPELLDYLAVEFVEHGWDLKWLIKQIVTSDTYLQRSDVTPEMLLRDPENRLLARGSRYRLPSWMLRDAALSTAGLLNPAIGGPPVKPYQPEGVWEEMFMGRFKYEASEGLAQHRRTVYAFWRRAIAPTFLFDSAQRRSCEVRPSRTNTPLQALTLLNDANYLDAAYSLAAGAIRSESEISERLKWLMRTIVFRPPTAVELGVVTRELDRAISHYRLHPNDADRLIEGLATRTGRTDAKIASGEMASYFVVANLILNLDEVLTHE